MMKSAVSAALGNMLGRAFDVPVNGRSYPAMSLARWRRIPQGVRDWLAFRVLRPVELSATRRLQSDPDYAPLLEGVNRDYAISNLSLQLLLDLMASRKAKSIVECGSGLSTAAFAQFARLEEAAGRPVPRIYSLDHEENWLTITEQRLKQFGLSSYVRFILAPISEQNLLGRSIQAYTLPPGVVKEWSDSNPEFDFCLIDGPPAVIGRFGSLPVLAPYLARSALVLLDDAFRPGEQQHLGEWRRGFSGSIGVPSIYLTARHGLAATEWTRPPSCGDN